MTLTTRVKLCLSSLGLIAGISLGNAGEPVWTVEDVLQSAEDLGKNIQDQALETPKVSAHLLVSLSMPKASLERLAEDAKLTGIILSFRGVPETESSNSLARGTPLLNAATLAPFEELIRKGVEVELNPEIFSELGVTRVPALVLKENMEAASGNCASTGKTLVMTGDVTLGYALDSISDRDDLFGEKARELRSRLGVRQ